MAVGAISYSSVKSILAENLDRLPLPEPAVTPEPPPSHDNLRGGDYDATEETDSMLINATVSKLDNLGLSAMAAALADQLERLPALGTSCPSRTGWDCSPTEKPTPGTPAG